MTMRFIAPFLVIALAAGACSSAPEEEPPDPKASEGAGTTLVETSPLTGEALPKGRPDNAVFVVKIENTSAGAPQFGLAEADLVVEELVEGGLTRLAAFFYSSLPSKVGHVRSLRATDIGIAKPVGGQIVASGGSGGTISKIEKAGVEVISEDAGAPGFSSDTAKSRPYNRLIDLKRLGSKTKASDVPGPYLTWSPAKGAEKDAEAEPSASPPAAPEKATEASVRFSRSTTTEWALKGKRWERTNGHAGGDEFEADTMIAMFAEVGDAGYLDPAGNPVPETTVKGSGRAVILTAEGALETTWTKKSNDSTISFEVEDGTAVAIDPGKVWIELVPEGDGSIDVR